MFCTLAHTSSIPMGAMCLYMQAGLEKVAISPWLVTLLHISGVTTTPQSPISLETLHKCRCLRIERRYRRIEWRVFEFFVMFHNVLRVFHVVWQCFKCFMMCYKWFTMFYDVSRCITMFLQVFHDALKVFHDVLLCLTTFYNV